MRLPKVKDGMKRGYYRCETKKCGRVYWRDFLPYSLSNPLLSPSCGHTSDSLCRITRKEFYEAVR